MRTYADQVHAYETRRRIGYYDDHDEWGIREEDEMAMRWWWAAWTLLWGSLAWAMLVGRE